VGLGILGMPWFSHASGGVAVLLGPTGGYFIGFILAPLLVGKYTDTYISSRKLLPQLGLMLAGVGIIYTCGALVLALVMHTNLPQTMLKAVLPFIPGDIFKALIAGGISTSILPKAAYNGEIDKDKYRKES